MDAREQEIRERLAKATRWAADDCEICTCEDGDIFVHQGATLGDTLIQLEDTYEGSGDDWNFLAHAPADLEYLLSQIDALRAERDALMEGQLTLQQSWSKDVADFAGERQFVGELAGKLNGIAEQIAHAEAIRRHDARLKEGAK